MKIKLTGRPDFRDEKIAIRHIIPITLLAQYTALMNVREYIFGGSALDSSAADAARALLRVVVGLALAFNHGIGKIPPSGGFVERIAEMGFPLPGLFAWLCIFAEVGCAFLLVVGLATRTAAAIIFLNMITVVFLAQAGRPIGDREDAILFLAAAFFFTLAGAGRYSFDRFIDATPNMTTQV